METLKFLEITPCDGAEIYLVLFIIVISDQTQLKLCMLYIGLPKAITSSFVVILSC